MHACTQHVYTGGIGALMLAIFHKFEVKNYKRICCSTRGDYERQPLVNNNQVCRPHACMQYDYSIISVAIA